MTNPTRNPSKTKTRKAKAARGQRVIVVDTTPEKEEEDVAEETTESLEVSQEPQDDLSSLIGAGFVRVSREKPNGEFSFLRKVDRNVLGDDISFIGKTWGGGRYFLEVFSEKKTWVRRFHMAFDEGEYGPPKFAQDIESVGEGIEVQQHDMAEQRINDYKEMAERQREADRAHNERMQSAQDNMMKFMMAALEKKNDVPVAPVTPPPTTEDIMKNVMEAADRMIQVRATPGNNEGQNTALNGFLTDVAKQVVERGLDGGGGGESGTPIERMGIKLVEVLGPFLARALASGTVAPQRAARPTVTGSPPGASMPSAPHTVQPAPPPTDTNDPPIILDSPPDEVPEDGNGGVLNRQVILHDTPMMQNIKSHELYRKHVPDFLEMSRINTPPSIAAEKINAAVPDEFFHTMKALVNHEDLVVYFSSFEPEVASRGQWVLAVRDELKKIIAETEEELEGTGSEVEETPANA